MNTLPTIKMIFPLKRAFLGESQNPVRRLSNSVSSFRIKSQELNVFHQRVTNMLP